MVMIKLVQAVEIYLVSLEEGLVCVSDSQISTPNYKLGGRFSGTAKILVKKHGYIIQEVRSWLRTQTTISDSQIGHVGKYHPNLGQEFTVDVFIAVPRQYGTPASKLFSTAETKWISIKELKACDYPAAKLLTTKNLKKCLEETRPWERHPHGASRVFAMIFNNRGETLWCRDEIGYHEPPSVEAGDYEQVSSRFKEKLTSMCESCLPMDKQRRLFSSFLWIRFLRAECFYGNDSSDIWLYVDVVPDTYKWDDKCIWVPYGVLPSYTGGSLQIWMQSPSDYEIKSPRGMARDAGKIDQFFKIKKKAIGRLNLLLLSLMSGPARRECMRALDLD